MTLLYIDVFINPFLKKALSLPVCITSLLKPLSEKEKLLVMSFYPFGELSAIFIKSEIVVWKLSQFVQSKICSLGKGLPFK